MLGCTSRVQGGEEQIATGAEGRRMDVTTKAVTVNNPSQRRGFWVADRARWRIM